ncbi:MAG: M3 family oligoendopeptidase [Chloroflexi bacterium]|nr:M3 family oligoendopeptidase [Chloroflexota bacterium]
MTTTPAPSTQSTFDPLDWVSIEPSYAQLEATTLTTANVRDWLQQWSDVAAVIHEASAQIYRQISEDTADEQADARYRHLVKEILPAVSQAEQRLKQKWLALENYQPTPETAIIWRKFRAEADIFRHENVPIISELHLLDKQYDEIIGGLSIEWQGEQKTIPAAEVLLADSDRSQRQRVWRLALAAFLERREHLNQLFLQLLQRRRRLAVNAGLKDFRSYQWLAQGRFDYTPADAATFHDAIESEVVPLATELYRETAHDLNLPSLRPWETSINSPWNTTVDPESEPLHPFQTAAELEDTVHRIFQQLNPAVGACFGDMRQGWLDLASRPHKAPGGYCNSFPVSGRPYIFMSAAGSHRNVRTLLHEGGHAFHFAQSYRQQSLVWNYDAPLEFAEVASMSMELLTIPYWSKDQGGFYDEHDLRRAIAEQLRGIVFFFPYMAVMDAFQHWLYTEAPADVDASHLDRTWSQLWDRFMPGIDYTGLQAEKETGWHRKGHIFGVPFYYIEYGLAQLGALQIWRNALSDPQKALHDYQHALALGYTRSLPELFAAAGARFAFDRATMHELISLVRQQLHTLG